MSFELKWIPAFAGMTMLLLSSPPALALQPDQTYLIDNFSKNDTNNLGHPSRVIHPENLKIKKRFVEEDAVREQGRSLELSFLLFGGNEISWTSVLEPLDLSQAQHLTFWLKGTWQVPAHVWVNLSDGEGNAREVPVEPYLGPPAENKKDWRPVLIPRDAFRGLNFDDLSELRITIRPKFVGIAGKAALDQVAFTGPRDVFFESLRDNLIAFPKTLSASERKKALLKLKDPVMLREIAKDTWKYFECLVDRRTQLVIDHVKLDDIRFLGDYTSPTNLAMYYMSCVAAYHLGFIPREEAVTRIAKSLESLVSLKQHRGFFYNFYNTTHLYPTNGFISSIDNAWLAVSLVVVRSAFPKELAAQATRLLDRMDFDFFFDPGTGQMTLGFDVKKNELSEYHYSLLSTETRMLSMIAIAKHDVPRDHWFQIFRTPPPQWKWQTQRPKEKERQISGYELRTGYYKYDNRRFVPSWGGSLFEFLMPTLVVPEKKWSVNAFGLNNRIVSEIHRDYALKERRYPVWGISPCSLTQGKVGAYKEFGIKALGVKGYNDAGIITPHATFLALETIPKDAIKNLREMLARYDIYGEYGFYDSVHVRGGIITRQYLALDQGMSLIALTNYLNNGSIQQLLEKDPVGKEIKDLLKDEEFF